MGVKNIKNDKDLEKSSNFIKMFVWDKDKMQ